MAPSETTLPASQSIALKIDALSKVFRVPHASAVDDPRREPLSRRKDNFWALREINFSVARGRTLGVVGHNGSGKSTLLKILAGVMSPDRGSFTAQGRIGALLELGAGFHPDLTGIQNVYLNGSLLGMTVKQVGQLLPEIIEFAELERFMDMPVRHFSSGMHARLGFAVATRLAPEILLMDETFATGDARFRAKALAHIGQMKQRGHTLLLVSHSMELLSELAEEVLWLDKGRMRALGEPRTVLAEYRRSEDALFAGISIASGFGGLASMFEPAAQPPGPVTFAEIEMFALDAEGKRTPAENNRLDLPIGARAVFSVLLRHDAVPLPRRVLLETAWFRLRDRRITAQSKLECELRVGSSETKFEFVLNGPTLHAAEWDVALGVRLAPPEDAGNEDATPPITFCDRRELPLRIVTHQPEDEIPTLTTLEVVWSVEAYAGDL